MTFHYENYEINISTCLEYKEITIFNFFNNMIYKVKIPNTGTDENIKFVVRNMINFIEKEK